MASKSILPIILYDIDGTTIKTRNIITISPCFYFYSYQNIDVEIISGTGTLYSVIQEDTKLITEQGQSFKGFKNFGYTLHIPTNNTECSIRITSKDQVSVVYKIRLQLINQITDENEHYNDLIINNYLPTLKELEPAILPGFTKVDLLKRMLLDFKHIMRVKGTKASIEKFFELVGFFNEQLIIKEEYRRYNSENKNNGGYWGVGNTTTNPDTRVDTKTGNYHVLYQNWNDGADDGKQALDNKNMPYRPFALQDFDVFFESLKHAIALANKYFTLVEQEITFFAICHSSNDYQYKSDTSYFNQIFVTDTCHFRKHLCIDLYYRNISENERDLITYLVKCNKQYDEKCYRTETKFIPKKDVEQYNNELYLIDREVSDVEKYSGPLIDYMRTFGACMSLDIKAPNMYVEVFIQNTINELSSIKLPKQYVEDTLQIPFITEKTDRYKVTIDIWDEYNVKERYIYYYVVADNLAIIDLEVFSSKHICELNHNINQITLDVDAPTINTKALSDNFILELDSVPDDLKHYYEALTDFRDYLTNASTERLSDVNPLYKLPDFNGYFRLKDISVGIPLNLSEQWVDVFAIELLPKYVDNIYIQLYDALRCKYLTVPIDDKLNEEFEYFDISFDKLFVRKITVTHLDDTDEVNNEHTYMMFITTDTGIKFEQKSFDIQIQENDGFHSIYDEKYKKLIVKQKILVNYDFPLFPIVGDEFVYLSNNVYKREVNEALNGNIIELPWVRSMFPRFTNITSGHSELHDTEIDKDFNLLKLNDVILARLNDNYIVNENNVVWSVINSFTGDVIHTTTDYMLKYRISDNSIYTITCDFDVDTNHYKLTKNNIFSSFEIKKF